MIRVRVFGYSDRICKHVESTPQSPLMAQSDLTSDIDSAEGRCFGWLEEIYCLAGQKSDLALFLTQVSLAAVLANEPGAFVIRFKAQFFGNETELDVEFVSAHTISRWSPGAASEAELTLYICWTAQLDARD